MKGVLIIIDGLGDLPHRKLDYKTPLEDANTPNLDFFASRGELGYMYPVKPGFIPESDEAIISIFRNQLISSTRGQLEARGAGINPVRGDLAIRANFATIDSLEKGNILDRRAGRTLTTKEAAILSKSLNKIELPKKFVFKPTIQHRGVLVFRGGFSDNISGNDLTYERGRLEREHKISTIKALDDEENSQYSANIVNEFLEKAYQVLDKHPVNEKRRKKGIPPANYLLLRGAGIETPKLKLYKKWISSSYMPIEIGFSKLSGMQTCVLKYPSLKKLDVYKNLHESLRKACKHAIKTIKKNHKKFDYAYIHLKETDVAGHDNKPLEKKEMIEFIDKTLISFLRRFSPKRKIKVVVTGDHSTPCKLKAHSADPVPVLFYSAEDSVIREKKFNEKEARKGTLRRILGSELLERIGFV